VEDHESREERHAVRREVARVHEEHPRDMRHAHPQGLMVRVLGRQGQHDRGADRYRPEGQGLSDQVRLAFPLPRPAAQDVADRRPGEPCGDRRDAGGRVPGPEQEGQHDLARPERRDRYGHEPAESLAQRCAEPAPQRRDKPRSCECHGIPSYSEDRRVIPSGIQYGNRTMLEVSDLRIAARPRWRRRRRRTGDADHRVREPPLPGVAWDVRATTLWQGQSKRQTDKAGARS
jgi:hypothetical protein